VNNQRKYKEPLSTQLRRHPHSDKTELTTTVRWVAIVSAFMFLSLTISFLIGQRYPNALVTALGIIPIIISIFLLKRDSVSVPSAILSVTLTVAITALATFGNGIYDIGVLGFPVILIVAGLILKGSVIWQLTLLILLCIAWLVFGNLSGLYQTNPVSANQLEDFFIASFIMIVAGNAVFRLTQTVFSNLARAEQENAIRRETEQRLQEVIQRLNAKNQELDRFAIRVSHDLKTPLITVAGLLGFLEKDLKAEDKSRVERNFSQINEAAKSMGKFVDELLDLSRIGRIINPPVDVAFGEIVSDALKAADGLLRARQVEVENEAIFPFVHVDRGRAVQVVQNLITNAVKFMGDQKEPKIKIGFREIEGEHIFSVSDNGIGISAEHHENIFELFSKLDPQTEGTGIGLGVAKRIIDLHGGRIWIQSELGKGSTFYFTMAEKRSREITA